MGKNLDFETKKQYTNYAIKWCKNFFGENERKRSKLHIEVTERKRRIKQADVFGNYCFYRNKMTIHTNTCRTLYELVSTVIHEYTHYLQSRNRYKYYQDNYYYSTNPYEKEARRNEDKYTRKCINDIKKLVK
jgi:Zn-dependent peptidase ImmA (M78 family)